MAKFFYKAKRGTGPVLEGELDADNARGVVEQILAQGLVPVDVREAKAGCGRDVPAVKIRPALRPGPARRRCPLAARQAVLQSLSDLVESEVPLLEALEITARQITTETARAAVKRVTHQVRDGLSFSEAAAGASELFDGFMVQLLRAGENGGFLARALRRSQEHLEKQAQLRSQLISAMLYPAVILTAGMITLVILLTVVLPKVTLIFADLDMVLPLPTRILMALTDGAVRWGWIAAIFLAAGVVGMRSWITTAGGRRCFDRVRLRWPLVGRLMFGVEVVRLGETLASLLGNGVPALPAYDAAAATLNNVWLVERLKSVRGRIADGAGLAAAVRSAGVLPDHALSLIAVGEHRGDLAAGWQRLSAFYQRDVERLTKIMTSLVEPLLILVIGVVVGLIVTALLLPIFRMNMGVG